MRAKLSSIEADILISRVFIARETKLLNMGELAERWNISRSTLFRYDSPYYRELSRLASQMQWQVQKGTDRSKCQLCDHPLVGHLCCTSCTMLLHGEPECAC